MTVQELQLNLVMHPPDAEVYIVVENGQARVLLDDGEYVFELATSDEKATGH